MEEVVSAGGILELEPEILSSRLGGRFDPRDSYAQHVLKRHLREAGVSATFRSDGSVKLVVKARGGRLNQPRPPARGAVSATPVVQPTTTSKPAATRPAANPTTAPAPEPASAPAPSADSLSARVGNGLYVALWIACTFFPAIGHQLAPGGEVGEKQEAFFAIYIATAPLSLAATFIFLMLFEGWFDNDRERLIAAGVAIVASAAWGIGFGTSYADMYAISQLQGPWYVVAFGVVALALGAYVIFYGWALFIAGVLASLFAALWIHEKAREGAGRMS